MELMVRRDTVNPGETLGELWIRECYTLEPSASAIPQGRYRVTLYDSPRFGMKVPILNDVPGHTFIEIHPGNTAADTHGCILVGQRRAPHAVEHSRAAYQVLFRKILQAMEGGDEVWVAVR